MRRAGASPFWLTGGALLCLAAGPSPTVTPTPTPKPKLSGGFGRAASTPVPSEQNGQSMADVVHAAETAKAPRDKKSAVTIDNTNLVTDPTKGRLTTVQAQPTPRPATAAGGRPAAMTPPTPTPTVALPLPGQPSAEEQKWREAVHAAKKRVEDAGKRVEELEAANHKLENDFYAWDDGQYRDRVIKPAWDKAKADLEAARQEQAAAEKDLADLPEKARKAGALPGWLRE
jgi:hypothetical protein